MTTFEVELEREKTEKLSVVAARGATSAAELGQDPETVSVFLHHYFRHVDPVDIDERTVDVHVGRLRKSINRAREVDPIRTVRGAGYSFDETFDKHH